MQHHHDYDFYSIPDSGRPDGAVLSADEAARLARLMRELMELTQSRKSYEAAADFLSRLTGEASQSTLVRTDVVAQ